MTFGTSGGSACERVLLWRESKKPEVVGLCHYRAENPYSGTTNHSSLAFSVQGIKGLVFNEAAQSWALAAGCFGTSSLPTLQLRLGDFVFPLTPDQYIVEVRSADRPQPKTQ